MPLPVIADVFRVTFDWSTSGGVTPRNVIHVQDLGHARSEADVGSDIGEVLGSVAHLFECVKDSYTLGQLTVIKLDGSSASVVVPFSTTNGQASGDIIPASSGVLSLRTEVRGPRGRGRLFLGPVGEGAQAGGILSSGVVSDMQAAWLTAADELQSLSPGLPLVVASYKHGDAHPVSNIIMDPVCGTQRRRQTQLRR